MLYRIVTSALFAGFAAGLIAALLQLAFVQPHLLHAEMFEGGELVHSVTAGSSSHGPSYQFDAMRDGLSILFAALIYTGYALMMVAGMAFASEQGHAISTRSGIIWGLAGFIAVHFAPAIGLPPELPGSSAADVGARQVWWFGTVGATALALWLIAFGRSWMAWGAAVVLLLAPHVIGAPHPDKFHGGVPPELGGLFAGNALGVGMAAWVVLGLLAAHFWNTEGKA